MTPELYWIPVAEGRLAIMARPRAGEWLSDEILGWRNAGVGAVVSLLEDSEIRELALNDEAVFCKQCGLEFISFPIPDRGVPTSIAATATLVDTVVARMRAGSDVAIHCRAGIGRSSLIAACVLLKLGVDREAAFRIVGQARGLAVPDTAAQEQWLALFSGA